MPPAPLPKAAPQPDVVATPARPPRLRFPAPDLAPYAVGALVGCALGAGLVLLGLPYVLGIPALDVVPLAALAGALVVWGAARWPRLRAWRRVPWVLLAAETALLAVVAYTPLVGWLVPPLVRRDPVGRAPLDGVVVLSGWVTRDGYLKPDVVDRLLSGLELVRATGARTLLLSRTHVSHGKERLTSDADQRRIVALLGARAPRILLVTDVYSTRDEAVKMRRLADSAGIRRVAVVTSPLHTRRACATFEHVGFDVVCAPAIARDIAIGHLGGPRDRVRAFQGWLYETAGTILYRARGWL